MNTTMDTPALSEIGLIELLECDSRPTFILDLERTHDPAHGLLHLAFSNPSLQRLPDILDPTLPRRNTLADEDDLEQYSDFEEWAISSPTYGHTADGSETPFIYQGLSWTPSTLRKRWRIVSGAAIGRTDTTARSFLVLPSGPQQDGPDVGTAPIDAHEIKEERRLQATMHPTWVDDLPASEHVQLFKSRDWSATALGPLETWPASLRQVTRILMADSRAASVFWYSI